MTLVDSHYLNLHQAISSRLEAIASRLEAIARGWRACKLLWPGGPCRFEGHVLPDGL